MLKNETKDRSLVSFSTFVDKKIFILVNLTFMQLMHKMSLSIFSKHLVLRMDDG